MRNLLLILPCVLLISVCSCKKDSENAVRCCKYQGAADCSESGIGLDSTYIPFSSFDCLCENGPWRDLLPFLGLDSSTTWEQFAQLGMSRDTTGTFHCDF